MKKIWAVCTLEMKMTFQSPSSWVLMIVLPLLFTYVFGSLLTGESKEKWTLLYIDHDKSGFSQSFIQKMKGEDLYILDKSSEKEAAEQLNSKEAAGVIRIPKGFGEKLAAGKRPDIEFERIPEFTSYTSITGIADDKLSEEMSYAAAAQAWSAYSGEDWEGMYSELASPKNPTGQLYVKKTAADSKEKENGLTGNESGFCIMFVMMRLLTMTGGIMEAKSNGIWNRLLCAPVSRFQASAGYLLSFFLTGWIQFGILMGASRLVFGLQWGDPLSLFFLVSAMLLAFVGIGLFVALASKTMEQHSSMAMLIVIPTCMLAGIYWPLEMEPVFMQKIAEFLPQTWAMRGFNELAAGNSLSSVAESAGVLLLYAVLFWMLGLKKMKKA